MIALVISLVLLALSVRFAGDGRWPSFLGLYAYLLGLWMLVPFFWGASVACMVKALHNASASVKPANSINLSEASIPMGFPQLERSKEKYCVSPQRNATVDIVHLFISSEGCIVFLLAGAVGDRFSVDCLLRQPPLPRASSSEVTKPRHAPRVQDRLQEPSGSANLVKYQIIAGFASNQDRTRRGKPCCTRRFAIYCK